MCKSRVYRSVCITVADFPLRPHILTSSFYNKKIKYVVNYINRCDAIDCLIYESIGSFSIVDFLINWFLHPSSCAAYREHVDDGGRYRRTYGSDIWPQGYRNERFRPSPEEFSDFVHVRHKLSNTCIFFLAMETLFFGGGRQSKQNIDRLYVRKGRLQGLCITTIYAER